MQSEALKPCPFCGGNNLRFRLSDIEGWIAHVECTDCDDMLGPMSEWKHDNKEDAEKDAAVVWNRRPCLEAALFAAEPVEHDENPMRFFADNVDKWGPLEWFNRLVDACEDHDRKRVQSFRCTDDDEKDMLSLSADTSKMIMSSSAFQLARNHKDEVLSALSAQVQDVAGWQPIETAPKDGTNILVWADGYQWPEVVRYEIYDDPIVEAEAGEKGYWRFSEDFLADITHIDKDEISHWMPLPAAPAKQEGGHD